MKSASLRGSGADHAILNALEFLDDQEQIVVMEPVVNCEEFIGKTVGRRVRPSDPLSTASGLQRSLASLCPLRIKRGVYRFNSHEEADQWLMDRLTRKQAS